MKHVNSKHIITGAALLLSLMASASAAIEVVTGDISTDTVWSSTSQYVLSGTANQGVIRVLPGATLTIEPGTIIRGQPRSSSANYDAGSLAVLRGGRIDAQGTSSDPIVFTTAAVDFHTYGTTNGIPDGQPDGFVRNGPPGSGADAWVIADRYDKVADPDGEHFWDADPKNSPQCPTMTGLWGGVIVLGRAPVNYADLEDELNSPPLQLVQDTDPVPPPTPYYYTKPIVEGLTSPDYAYGSDWATNETVNGYTGLNYVDVDDNSGILRYISIRHGGIQLAADNEINGLTLGGVGRGTKIDHIEVWGNEDDGIEIFGGTVNLSHLAIFSTKDDGLDLDHGYSGQIQFVLAVGGSYGEKLLEWDGDDANEFNVGKGAKANFEPRGNWEVRNVTLIGGPTENPSSSAGVGANIRSNASSKLYNVIIANIPGTRNSITDTSTFWNVIRHVTYPSANAVSVSSATVFSNGSTANPGLGTISFAVCEFEGDTEGLQKLTHLNPVPGNSGGSSLAWLSNYSIPAGQCFFQTANYRGAFDPGITTKAGLWTTGWTAASAADAVTVP
ncbi:hypothetical protein OH491_18630 [Termitidicoccus mucosus]|uniref:G8 domain-containing protein n=1 Tax=Termitidicoccus mucosus TaxID=1184151 RepID=A0A178ILN0_9BACT|nr:hypothetical protein AW736_09995 [Opitutaceae bacterium TSB47]